MFHNDIKPENYRAKMIEIDGKGLCIKPILIDLGIITESKEFDFDKGNNDPKGTPFFMSIFQHEKMKSSYRDDL